MDNLAELFTKALPNGSFQEIGILGIGLQQVCDICLLEGE